MVGQEFCRGLCARGRWQNIVAPVFFVSSRKTIFVANELTQSRRLMVGGSRCCSKSLGATHHESVQVPISQIRRVTFVESLHARAASMPQTCSVPAARQPCREDHRHRSAECLPKKVSMQVCLFAVVPCSVRKASSNRDLVEACRTRLVQQCEYGKACVRMEAVSSDNTRQEKVEGKTTSNESQQKH